MANPEHYTDLLNQPEIEHIHHHREAHHHEHHEHHHHHSEHLETDGFVSVSFISDRPFSLTKFQNFLDQLPADVFRSKGILLRRELEQCQEFEPMKLSIC